MQTVTNTNIPYRYTPKNQIFININLDYPFKSGHKYLIRRSGLNRPFMLLTYIGLENGIYSFYNINNVKIKFPAEIAKTLEITKLKSYGVY